MRIAHVTATFPPYYAGTGLVCYHNARELVRRGHEVHVFTARVPEAPAEEVLDGVQVHRLRPLFRLGNAPFLPGLLRLNGFDLIHLHYPFIFGAEMIRIVSALRRVPFVLTHHNDLIGDGNRRWLFQIYSSISTPWVFYGAQRLLPVSRDYAEHGQLAHLFARYQPKLVEVSNGVDVEAFKPTPRNEHIRAALGIPAEVPLGLFVAVLDRAHHFKGLTTLLTALAQPELNKTHLLVIGDGELRTHYEVVAAQLHIKQRVHFAGNISHSSLPSYLSIGDYLVLPSLPPESFGLVLIEAFACGIPVIASNIPGVRTVVTDGVDGYLVEPGNFKDLASKINRMLELTAVERQGMGAAGRRKVEQKYTWEMAGQHLDEIYQSIIADGLRPSFPA